METHEALRKGSQGAHMHSQPLLLADIAEETPARATPAEERQAAPTGHRDINTVGAERGMLQRPICRNVLVRRLEVVHHQVRAGRHIAQATGIELARVHLRMCSV